MDILNFFTLFLTVFFGLFFFFHAEGKQFKLHGIIFLTTIVILVLNWHSKAEYLAARLALAGDLDTLARWLGWEPPFSYRDFLQAGKSVAGVHAVEPAGAVDVGHRQRQVVDTGRLEGAFLLGGDR